MPPFLLRHIHIPGIVPFALAQSLQQRLVTKFLAHKALVSTPSPRSPLPPAPLPTILTFTPTPVYTTGRREHDALTPSQISLLQSPLYPTSARESSPEPQYAQIVQTLRGGQTTFHGPGQLIVYPIIDLRSTFPKWPKGISVRCYVHLLESATIATLALWGIKGVRTENPGVWEESGEKKIAALGVHLRRSISSYGVGLNVYTDLRWFERIVACGLVGKGVTSMWAMEENKPGFFRVEDFEMEAPSVRKHYANDLTRGKDALGPGLVGVQWVHEFVKGLYGEYEERNVMRQYGVVEDGTLELRDSIP